MTAAAAAGERHLILLVDVRQLIVRGRQQEGGDIVSRDSFYFDLHETCTSYHCCPPFTLRNTLEQKHIHNPPHSHN